MSSIEEECRLCGEFSRNIKIKLCDKIKGFISYKQFCEYFCRIDLDDSDLSLPQCVCEECYKILLNFCKFTINVEKQQNKFKNRLPRENLIANIKTIDENENDDSLVKRRRLDSSSNASSSNSSSSIDAADDDNFGYSRKSKRKRNGLYQQAIEELKIPEKKEKSEITLKDCLYEVKMLFENDTEVVKKQYEKIQIKTELLLPKGEIPKNWLLAYKDCENWQDLIHQCLHCNKTIKSMKALLQHFDENKISNHKRAIKCAKCEKVFKENIYLVSYINHMTRTKNNRFRHLKFSCFLCDRVFVNVVKLSDHLIEEHGSCNYRLFPCFDCGLVCSTFDKLTQHKTSHDI